MWMNACVLEIPAVVLCMYPYSYSGLSSTYVVDGWTAAALCLRIRPLVGLLLLLLLLLLLGRR